jgi:prepilin-type processing-associated H-X9-DG protein
MDEFFKSHISNSVFWSAIGHGERINVIQSCEKIIGEFGYILEFKQFSDLGLSLHIDVQSDKIKALYDSLKQALRLDNFDFKEINDKTSTVYLNISFADGHGDLKVEIPEVPG